MTEQPSKRYGSTNDERGFIRLTVGGNQLSAVIRTHTTKTFYARPGESIETYRHDEVGQEAYLVTTGNVGEFCEHL